ncbi:MAG: hypothetical protein ACP5FH_09450 [Terracidiphilus sp.]
MSAFPAAPQRYRSIVIAIFLCFLALSFAMEAKMARYARGEGHVSYLSAAKAAPADTPRLVFHGVFIPGQLHSPYSAVLLFAQAAAFVVEITKVAGYRVIHEGALVSSVLRFYPSILFRPPPGC